MQRVVILGRGGAGKSTAARALAERTGLPVIELDSEFWSPDLEPMALREWRCRQAELVTGDGWILDGDLGPYDDLSVRLRAADTVVVLDFSFCRCAWQAVRRSRERLDFWSWLALWRRRSRPVVLAAVARHAPTATVLVFRTPGALAAFLTSVTG